MKLRIRPFSVLPLAFCKEEERDADEELHQARAGHAEADVIERRIRPLADVPDQRQAHDKGRDQIDDHRIARMPGAVDVAVDAESQRNKQTVKFEEGHIIHAGGHHGGVLGKAPDDLCRKDGQQCLAYDSPGCCHHHMPVGCRA